MQDLTLFWRSSDLHKFIITVNSHLYSMHIHQHLNRIILIMLISVYKLDFKVNIHSNNTILKHFTFTQRVRRNKARMTWWLPICWAAKRTSKSPISKLELERIRARVGGRTLRCTKIRLLLSTAKRSARVSVIAHHCTIAQQHRNKCT